MNKSCNYTNRQATEVVQPTLKEHMRNWLQNDIEVNFNASLTVTPKKVFYKYVPASKGVKDNKLYRHATKNELVEASHRLVALINKLIYKNAYKRYGKKLDIVMTIEGEASAKDLHTHMGIALPSEMTVPQFEQIVEQALSMSGEFEIENPNYCVGRDSLDKMYQYKTDYADRGWSGYITKELDRHEVRNLFFP